MPSRSGQRAFILGVVGGVLLAALASGGMMTEALAPIIGLGVALPIGWGGYDLWRRR
jgi:hypothetical protein